MHTKIRITTVFWISLRCQFCFGDINMESNNEPAILPDYARINILNDDQVVFWTKHLNVTERQLRNAVFISGPIAKHVKEYLDKNQASKP